MASSATVLSSPWLRAFIKEHVVEFRAIVDKMLKDGPDGLSVDSLSNGSVTDTTIMSKRPLILGLMAGDADMVGGAALNQGVQKSATAISEILKDHQILFADLEEALWETIKKLTDTQKKSLDQISADDFLDIFDDVDSDTGGAKTEK
ncbi:type VII secretion system-associated protein [Streptomyces sp. NPDC002403]